MPKVALARSSSSRSNNMFNIHRKRHAGLVALILTVIATTVNNQERYISVALEPPLRNAVVSSTSSQESPVLKNVGTQYGGWTYDTSNLSADSMVYSIGLGEDTSWDEGIMKKHGLQVWGFDPTPKSLKFLESRQELRTDRFHLIAEGLATTKHKATFTMPKNPDHVSMREGDLSNLGDTVEVLVNTLENWMEANGQTHLDIVKMDIEGSEYDVMEDWIARDFFPMDQLLVEWHFRWLDEQSRHDRVLKGLIDRGWYVAHSQNNGQEQTFLRTPALS